MTTDPRLAYSENERLDLAPEQCAELLLAAAGDYRCCGVPEVDCEIGAKPAPGPQYHARSCPWRGKDGQVPPRARRWPVIPEPPPPARGRPPGTQGTVAVDSHRPTLGAPRQR